MRNEKRFRTAFRMPIVAHHPHQQRIRFSSDQFSWIVLLQTIQQFYKTHVTPEMTIYAIKSLRDLILMGAELLTENTMIQVISSMEHHRQPLRDVAEEFFSQPNRSFIDFAYFGADTYQVDTNSVLLLWVFFCFFHGPRGFAVLQKGVRCLTLTRALRVFTFSITILPNPNPACNFTGPINPWNLSPGGACNDLLYSGHVTVYTISAIAVTILCGLYPFFLLRAAIRIFIWTQVFQRMIRAILEFHHYSVDMFLGFFVTLLFWHAEILYYDLPQLPRPLYPHLKQLIFPYDSEGIIDSYVAHLTLICRRFKRQPIKTFVDLVQHQQTFASAEIHLKQV